MNKFKSGDYVIARGFKGFALYVIGNSSVKLEECFCDHGPTMYESYCPFCNGDEEFPSIECDEIYDCVMVGDDQIHRIHQDDLEPFFDENEFCRNCGQIGCGWH